MALCSCASKTIATIHSHVHVCQQCIVRGKTLLSLLQEGREGRKGGKGGSDSVMSKFAIKRRQVEASQIIRVIIQLMRPGVG